MDQQWWHLIHTQICWRNTNWVEYFKILFDKIVSKCNCTVYNLLKFNKNIFEKINEDMSWLRKNSDKFIETWWWKPSVYTWYIPHSTILVYIYNIALQFQIHIFTRNKILTYTKTTRTTYNSDFQQCKSWQSICKHVKYGRKTIQKIKL